MPQTRHSLLENLRLALDTLRSHKFRSFLTVLGVLIGTTTVILVASLIAGLEGQITETMRSFGGRNLYIFKFEPGINFHLTREERLRKPLTYDMAMDIRDQCQDVEAVAVELFSWNSTPPVVKYKGQDMLDANFVGATADDFRVNNSELKDGRFYTDIDNLHRNNVAVIGDDVVTRFFANEDPVGKYLVIDGLNFQVVGTIAKRKSFLGRCFHFRAWEF